MKAAAEKSHGGILDPMERLSEVLFGLIMVLTYTGTLGVVTADRMQINTMLIGAVGCNLAWGIIDAGMYLMACVHEQGRRRCSGASSIKQPLDLTKRLSFTAR